MCLNLLNFIFLSTERLVKGMINHNHLVIGPKPKQFSIYVSLGKRSLGARPTTGGIRDFGRDAIGITLQVHQMSWCAPLIIYAAANAALVSRCLNLQLQSRGSLLTGRHKTSSQEKRPWRPSHCEFSTSSFPAMHTAPGTCSSEVTCHWLASDTREAGQKQDLDLMHCLSALRLAARASLCPQALPLLFSVSASVCTRREWTRLGLGVPPSSSIAGLQQSYPAQLPHVQQTRKKTGRPW